MGRKGVSKRKPPQAKTKPVHKNTTVADFFSKESSLVKPTGTDKNVAQTSRGNGKHSSNIKNHPEKR